MDAVGAALAGAGIGALVSVFAVWMNRLNTKQTLRQVATREFGRISVEYMTQQLNEFYGPLLLLLEQSKSLADKLREGKGDPAKWHLLDHLPEVLGNDQDKAIVDEIMRIGAKLEELIISKGGLIRGPERPKSFGLYLGHRSILKLAIEGKERPNVADFQYYPSQLNDEVKEAYDAIQSERADLLTRYQGVK